MSGGPGASRRRDLRGLVVPGLLFVGAEVAAFATGLESDSLAAPSAVVMAGIQAIIDGSVLAATRDTLVIAFTGLAIGGSIGLGLGLLLGSVPVLDRLLEFSVESVRPIPAVALIPIAMLVFGFGYRMEIAIVAFGTTWPVLIITRAAITGIEPGLIEVARLLQLGLLARVGKIMLPAALPRIFIGFRLAAAIALIIAVTVEIAANTLGLGHAMIIAEQTLRPALTLSYLAWVSVLGWGLNHSLVHAQHRLFGAAAVVGERA